LKHSRWYVALPIAALLVALTSCSTSSSSPFNATPAISGLFPDTLPANGLTSANCANATPVTMNIGGTGFIATSQAQWNGSNRTSTYNPDSTQLAVSLLGCDLTTPGKAQVTVTNPAPGGGTSAAATFIITQPDNPAPVIGSISPTSTPVGVLPPGGVLTINSASSDQGFVPTSQVAFNGNPRTVVSVTSTQITAQVLSSDVANNASISVTVSNPAPGGGVSPAVVFTVGTGAAVRAASLEVVSVNAQGGGANGPSAAPAMSADGRYVAFYSQARNLVAKGASGNIFVRDTCLGAINCTPQTTAVDLARDGSAPNGMAGEHLAMSSDGRYVAFVSSASNLVSGMKSEASSGGMPADSRVFVRDLCLGASAPADCAPRTMIVSVDAGGNAMHGLSPSISGDGRFVAFVSWNLQAGQGSVPGTPAILVRDTCAGQAASAGCVPRTYRLPGENQSEWVGDAKPAISSDGRYVAFERWTSGSTAGDGAMQSRILLRDTCLGVEAPAGCLPSTTTLSVSPAGRVMSGLNMFPSMNEDGRYVAFVSLASSSSLGGAASPQQLYLRDTCLGIASPENCEPSTISIATGAAAIPGYPSAFSPWVSASGRYVTFIAGASENANTNEAPREGILFVRDTCVGAAPGCVARTFAVTAPEANGEMAPLSVYKFTQIPLTADGKTAAFYSPFAVPAAPESGMGDVYISPSSY
jgi:Tol biopolymer transport system component